LALQYSLFHEPWWLAAVSGGRYEEAVVQQGGKTVGRLPYLPARRGPFRISRMPPFTHLLGPLVDAGVGKPQSRMAKRLSIVRALIDQLPRFAYIEQHFDPSIDDGLAIADGLAFQDRNFMVAPQYTFEIDCRRPPMELWAEMHFKTRQHIRRAEEKYQVRDFADPEEFARIYQKNIGDFGKSNRMDFKLFPGLFSECRARNCGEILAAYSGDQSPVSLVYLVWSPDTMYYLMSTRSAAPSDNGSVNLLIWSAMQRAHERGLKFDLDGVYTSGTARFLSGFGGQIKTRLVAKRCRPVFRVLQSLKLQYSQNETQFFT
jgi:lipid II:glycine glycyltransferase (peptidoglycan interpeptide bridge formation enzyme)